ncbi:MAG: hypothetical protein NC215_00410 [Ruminococcus sp.]|nr:hypothetical protein [Ruminococcus sp.]
MNTNTMMHEYFDWLCESVCKNDIKRNHYRKLLIHLHNTEFTYIIGMDGNRVEDGINMRYRFAQDFGYSPAMIPAYLDNKPCSILEMMVALAIRCNVEIIGDDDVAEKIFWSMISNLGLRYMTNEDFDPAYVEDVVNRFLNREYERDGKGGLFRVRDCKHDMRSVEIWYQMNWYLNSVA